MHQNGRTDKMNISCCSDTVNLALPNSTMPFFLMCLYVTDLGPVGRFADLLVG